MSSKMFVVGTKAKGTLDRVIYDQNVVALYYDADGTGKTAQIKIAQLTKGLAMTYKDFWVT